MFIDTESREGMQKSLAYLMDVSVLELNQCINTIAISIKRDAEFSFLDRFYDALEDMFVRRIKQKLPDELLFFHLSRRLTGSEMEPGYNLRELLTSKNAFSDFLRAHSITFGRGTGNSITLFYRGVQKDLSDTSVIDICCLRRRLGYNAGTEDFSFNGLAFRDLLMKNQYSRSLSVCPEIIQSLGRYLNLPGLEKDYESNSNYYCFKFKIPIERVIFDGKDDYRVKQKQFYLLKQIGYRLYQYNSHPYYMEDNENPILRLAADDCAPVEFLISSEVITLDMIEC